MKQGTFCGIIILKNVYNLKQKIPAVRVNSRSVFANTKTLGVWTSYMKCKPTMVGHMKYMREHPPALQVKTRGVTDQWGFFALWKTVDYKQLEY